LAFPSLERRGVRCRRAPGENNNNLERETWYYHKKGRGTQGYEKSVKRGPGQRQPSDRKKNKNGTNQENFPSRAPPQRVKSGCQRVKELEKKKRKGGAGEKTKGERVDGGTLK